MRTRFLKESHKRELSVWIFGLFLFLVTFLLLAAQPAFAHPGHGSHLLPNLTERILTPQLTVTGLILAFSFGAVHALTPGHGKAIVTTYLIGSNSTFLHAFLLSIVATVTHTLGIFLLGLVVLFASHYILPEQLYYIFSLLSGIAICVIGFWRLESCFNSLDEKRHHHHHHFSDNNVTPGSLITLGMTSGLVPCPEALILLLGAIAIHREIYGLLLVATFSLGLALVLTIVGLVAVYSRQWLDRIPQFNIMQTYLPFVSAVAIAITGLILTTEAMI